MADPLPGDIPRTKLIVEMDKALKDHPGADVYVKWTCWKCGERVMSDEPNVFRTGGYKHDEPHCGATYFGPLYGFALVFPAFHKVQVKEGDLDSKGDGDG